jgi:hypothetical protein
MMTSLGDTDLLVILFLYCHREAVFQNSLTTLACTPQREHS